LPRSIINNNLKIYYKYYLLFFEINIYIKLSLIHDIIMNIKKEKRKTRLLYFIEIIKTPITFSFLQRIIENETKYGYSVSIQCITCHETGVISPGYIYENRSIFPKNKNIATAECQHCGNGISKGFRLFRLFYT